MEGIDPMTVKDLIKILENLNSNDEVRIVYNTAQPMWAKSIEIGDVAEQGGTVYIIENGWSLPEWIPEGLIEE